MNVEQIKLLNKMKKLIRDGKRRFELRGDRDYILDLLDLGITEEKAWGEILLLNAYFYVVDYKPSYKKSSNSLVFKKEINHIMAYIKLKIEIGNDEEIVVCLSFHRDKVR